MAVLGKDKIHYIEKVLLYTPIMVGVFLALSVWGGGLTFGLMGVGLILIGVLLDSIKKIAGNNRRFVPPMSSIFLIALGVYSLIDMDIYIGIFYMLVGMSLIFDKFLKGKWKHICCTVTIGLAVGAFILGEINDGKSQAIENEVGLQQDVTGKRYFHA